MTSRSSLAQYLVGDARHIGTLLPAGKEIDLTITSPPYWNLKDYHVKDQIGHGQAYADYLDDLQRVFKQVFDRTRSTGSLWIVSDTFKQAGELRLLPFDLAARVSACGWTLQDVIVWHKDRTLPWSHQGKLRNIFEYITYFTKTKTFKYDVSRVRDVTDLKDYWVKYPERYSPEGKTPSRAWHFSIPRQGSWGTAANFVKHACPLPAGLVQRIVDLASDPGDLIVDPFAGSGTVLAVAHAKNRQYFGTDLSSKHQRLFGKTVLPAVIKKLHAAAADAGEGREHRERFTALVESLRKLKLPKELLRLYRSRFGQPKRARCTAIWVSPRERGTGVNLVFVLQNASVSHFVARARKLCQRPPLTKYGLQITVSGVRAESLSRATPKRLGMPAKKKIFEYSQGRFYSWSWNGPFAEAASRCQSQSDTDVSRYPPIYSTLAIRIDPRRPADALRATENGQATIKKA